jgi:hypothetical protein
MAAMTLGLAGAGLAAMGCSADAFGPAEPTGQSEEHLDQTAWYQVISMTSGLCADDSGNSLDNGTPIIQWGCSQTKTNQRWQFVYVGGGYYHIVNQLSGKCLDMGGSTTSGTGIKQWSCGTSQNLSWSLIYRNGWYQIKSQKSGFCLDNTGSDDSGDQLIQKTCSSSSSNQMWALDELTSNQQKIAYALTSIWENDDPVLHYEYSENINDGRGYTSGRAGFCSQTGDMILVADCFNDRTSNSNKLYKYWNELVAIDNRHKPDYDVVDHTAGDVSGLNSIASAAGTTFNSDWSHSYTDSATKNNFKSCQDQITNKLYLLPAVDAAVNWGFTYALTQAELYDAFINHGEDGAKAIISSTNSALGVPSSVTSNVIGYNGITEDAWLKKFLEKRRDVLYGDGSSTWTDAMDRVAAYEKARRRHNYDLTSAITNDVRARDCWSHSPSYPDSLYTCRTINADGSFTTPSSCSYSCN